MSEETADTAESSDVGSLEEAVEEEGSEQLNGGSDSSENAEESAEYDNSRNYNKEKAGSKGEKAQEKKGNGLEQRLTNAEAELIRDLVKEGLSEAEARELVSSLKASHDRKEYNHNWLGDKEYSERIGKYSKNAKIKDLIKGAWYLFFALTDVVPPRDPFEEIDKAPRKGRIVVYLPGYLAIPRDVEPFKKALGEEVVYVDSTNLEYIHQVIRQAAEKHGRVQVVGFSDGGKLIEDYINTYGDRLVDRFYSVAANSFNAKSSRVTHIIGDRDRLASLEKEYTWLDKGHKGPKPEVVYGGHTYFCFDSRTLSETAAIINASRPTRAYYTVRAGADSPLVMRSAENLDGLRLLNPDYHNNEGLRQPDTAKRHSTITERIPVIGWQSMN